MASKKDGDEKKKSLFVLIKKFFRKSDYKMLLIGETGSGKTSFLNLICNYGQLEKLGCKFDIDGFEKLQRFNDPELEDKKARHMESKTSGAKSYDVAADLHTKQTWIN